MALTETEIQQALRFLGIPAISGTWNAGTQGQTLRERLAELSSDAEAGFKALLVKIEASRTDLEGARGRLKASKVGDIELNPGEIKARWREDLELCEQLGQIVNMPVYRHRALKRQAVEVL